MPKLQIAPAWVTVTFTCPEITIWPERGLAPGLASAVKVTSVPGAPDTPDVMCSHGYWTGSTVAEEFPRAQPAGWVTRTVPVKFVAALMLKLVGVTTYVQGWANSGAANISARANFTVTMLTPRGKPAGWPPTRGCRRARKWYRPDPGGQSAGPAPPPLAGR